MTSVRSPRRTALALLLLAIFFWGLSFPLIKSLALTHQALLPASNSWFITAMTVAPRFVLGVVVLLALARAQLANLTRREVAQGLLLGGTAALGMLFQNDGLQFTSASTSAFLTQFYAILIPLWLAWRHRRNPGATVWGACALVVAGVAVLARVDPRELHLGRGELETLLSSVFFMGQILVLGSPRFAGTRVLAVTTVMFAAEAVAFSGLALVTAPSPADVLVPWTSGPWLGFTVLLTVFCTLGSYLLMNRWQPVITTTEAGLLYCTEPLFASAMALFLPALFSAWAGIAYANETLTWHLLAGGGLVTAANVLIELRRPPPDA